MKTIDVIFAFKSRKSARTGSVKSDKYKLFSYYTCIAQWYSEDVVILNETKYSRSTSKHQTYLNNAFETSKDIKVLKVSNVPIGRSDLTRYLDATQKEFLMIF